MGIFDTRKENRDQGYLKQVTTIREHKPLGSILGTKEGGFGAIGAEVKKIKDQMNQGKLNKI